MLGRFKPLANAVSNPVSRATSPASRNQINYSRPRSQSEGDLKTYATYRVHTPDITTSSPESLANNPVVTLHRKKGTVATQHPEIVETKCETPGCSNKVCDDLCETQKGDEMSKGHLAHSETHATTFVSDNPSRHPDHTQYAVMYEKPHITSGRSINPISDLEKSKTYNEDIKEIMQDHGIK